MGEAYIGDNRKAVTRIKLYDMSVSQIKTQEKDGYQALQIKANGKSHEIPMIEGVKVGDTIKALDGIETGTTFNVQGTTKGKGFAGVVKRHGFAGGFKTHGQSDRHRAPGSIGQGTTPGRVHKGKKMAGRMGGVTHTVKNAVLVAFDGNDVYLTGPVPGNDGGTIKLIMTGKTELDKLTFLTGGIPENKAEENNSIEEEVKPSETPEKVSEKEETKDSTQEETKEEMVKEEVKNEN